MLSGCQLSVIKWGNMGSIVIIPKLCLLNSMEFEVRLINSHLLRLSTHNLCQASRTGYSFCCLYYLCIFLADNFLKFCLPFKSLLIYLFWKSWRERDLPSAGLLSRWPQWLSAGPGGSSIQVSQLGDRCSDIWAISYFKPFAETLIGSGKAGKWTGVHMGCWHSRQQLYPQC